MTGYIFYESKEANYLFGCLDRNKARQIAADLIKGARETDRINQAVALHFFSGKDFLGKGLEEYVASAVGWGSLSLETEFIYADKGGKSIVAQVTADEYDLLLENPLGMFRLATFENQREGTILKIHSLHQIGIDPQFLYDLGKKYEKKIKNLSQR